MVNTITGKPPMNSEKSPKVSEMHDVAVARGIIDDTFGLTAGRRSVVIGLTIAALKRVERALDPAVLRQRGRQWTERRVRSIVDLEARRIDAYEISDLEQVKISEARHEFSRSRDRAARMAAFLAAQDPDFHCDEVERMGAFARGVDLPGVVRGGAGK
jgi:hypothetical protein